MLDILAETTRYIEKYGQPIAENITLIPESQLDQYRNVRHAFRIQTEILEGPATIVVGLPSDFPSSLPKFFDAQRQFGYIPHLEDDGLVCYTRDENLVIDERFPGAVVLECLKKVIDVIEQGELEANNQDFLEEYEVYWAKTCLRDAHTMINEQNETLRELDLFLLPSEEEVTYFICEKTFNPVDYVQTALQKDISGATKRRCIYIPLDDGTFIKPPMRGQRWDIRELKVNIFDHIDQKKKKTLLQLLQRTPKSNIQYDYFILGLPIDNNKKAVFGIVINCPDGMVKNRKAKVRLHPLVQSPANITLYPFSVTRHHKEFLLFRTGGDSALITKSAVVIGVGAIGSVVAMGLVKAGFGTITLIDHDRLDVENIYRHALGVDQLYNSEVPNNLVPQKKVDAMKKEILRKYPLTTVHAIDKRINAVLEGNEVQWEKIDVVVVCVGAPNVEMRINRFMHRLSAPPPVIYAWVEPFGIGGHVLVTLNKEKKGCYQCLFRPISDEHSITNLSAFSKTGQSFTKSLGGCGTYFTPYSFLDSEETANRVLRTVYLLSRKQLNGNPILSWKGDATLFLQEGFQISERYSMSDEELHENRTNYYDPQCPVCSNKETAS